MTDYQIADQLVDHWSDGISGEVQLSPVMIAALKLSVLGALTKVREEGEAEGKRKVKQALQDQKWAERRND